MWSGFPNWPMHWPRMRSFAILLPRSTERLDAIIRSTAPSRVGNRPGRVGQSLLADPIPIFSGSGHLMPDPVPTLVGIISGSTRSRTHLGEVLADPDRDLDRVAEFNPRYLT